MYKKRNAFRDLASESETRVGGIISEDIFFLSRVNVKFDIFFSTSIGTMECVVERDLELSEIYSEY